MECILKRVFLRPPVQLSSFKQCKQAPIEQILIQKNGKIESFSMWFIIFEFGLEIYLQNK